MKEILLNSGAKALVDDEDYPELSKFKWSEHKSRNTSYAARNKPEEFGTVMMHNEIMGISIELRKKGIMIHHKNGNGLDNQKENLPIIWKREHNKIHSILKIKKRIKGAKWQKRKNWNPFYRLDSAKKNQQGGKNERVKRRGNSKTGKPQGSTKDRCRKLPGDHGDR